MVCPETLCAKLETVAETLPEQHIKISAATQYMIRYLKSCRPEVSAHDFVTATIIGYLEPGCKPAGMKMEQFLGLLATTYCEPEFAQEVQRKYFEMLSSARKP